MAMLDIHCQLILDEFQEVMPTLQKMKDVVTDRLTQMMSDNNIYINAIESRIKTVGSLEGKLERKGHKYKSLEDITDLLGARIITFYSDEVDKISALVEKTFNVDWSNSVDKRKLLELDQFGYQSLHYICRIPEQLYHDPAFPRLNTICFEIQMRTALQHVWATINHDTGYKSGIEIPKEHLRNINRIAGMLELADEQFSRIRMEITEYRRHVQALVADGNFDDVPLDGDTWRSYLALEPFKKLATRIAAINQAEVYADNLMPYLEVFSKMRFKTLGDIERLIHDYSDDAYQLVLHQIAGTDLDIFALSITVQNLCSAKIIRDGYGVMGLIGFYHALGGNEAYNKERAERVYQQAKEINMVNGENNPDNPLKYD